MVAVVDLYTFVILLAIANYSLLAHQRQTVNWFWRSPLSPSASCLLLLLVNYHILPTRCLPVILAKLLVDKQGCIRCPHQHAAEQTRGSGCPTLAYRCHRCDRCINYLDRGLQSLMDSLNKVIW